MKRLDSSFFLIAMVLTVPLVVGCETLGTLGTGAGYVVGMAGAVSGEPELLIHMAELEGEDAEEIRQLSRESKTKIDANNAELMRILQRGR